MNTQRICPSCGKALAEDAPQGLCPECLMKGAMAASTAGPSGGSSRFEPPSVHDIAQLFPQLEVISLLGHGGMGAVYKARQPGLDRLVALKILPPRPGNDPGFADRFTREARALAKLNHPNIVAVYDFGQAGSLHYFIMEYVDGANLRQLEQSAKLFPTEALKIIPQICEALQYAHEEGIVHRDIKPENVLLDKKGRVKIADFGLAKLLGQAPQDFRLTGTRDVMGTPHYMAPEQVEQPQAVDHRADIYSLGVVFYEMLTGELPLGRFGPPSTRTRDVHIDVRLDEVVLRALEREPERRYQSASEVKTDLQSISEGKAPPPLGTTAAMPAPVHGSAEQVRKEVRAPAWGLLATGILNWVLLPMILYIALPAMSRSAMVTPVPRAPSSFLLLILALSPFVLCSFVMYAALRMQRLEGYGVAIAASIVAMLVTPGNIIGLPIGLWSLITLSRRDVRAAFKAVQQQRGTASRRRPWLWASAAILAVVALLVALRLPFAQRAQPVTTTSSQVLFAPAPTNHPLSQEIELLEDGTYSASCSNTQTFQLFEVNTPAPVENCILMYQARLKTEGLAGRAYLEMWCSLSGQQEFFSRGLASAISGATDWVSTQTPFFLRPGEKADHFRLNLVVEGRGRVFVENIRLESTPNR